MIIQKNPPSILSTQEKKTLIKQLSQHLAREVLSTLLKQAALDSLKLPSVLAEEAQPLIIAYKQQQNCPEIFEHLEKALDIFFAKKAPALLKNDIENVEKDNKNLEHWHSTFLLYLAEGLEIKRDLPSYIQGTIAKGKVYWELTHKGERIHSNISDNDKNLFVNKKTFTVPYDKFQLFKRAGKRHGNAKITREKFVLNFIEQCKVNAGKIWDELKVKGIITDKDKLNPAWHTVSNIEVTVKAVNNCNISYNTVMDILERILNENGHEPFNLVHKGKRPYRPHREKKQWCSTSRIKNQEPQKENHINQLWDVGLYKELVIHRDTESETKQSHGKLNYDHVPSKAAIKRVCKLKAMESKDKEWWTIAIPEKMHTQGETFFTSNKEQTEAEFTFLSNVQFYMQWLTENIKKFDWITLDEAIKALGAFRTLYHNHLKNYVPINTVEGKNFELRAEPKTYFDECEDTDKIDEYFIDTFSKLGM